MSKYWDALRHTLSNKIAALGLFVLSLFVTVIIFVFWGYLPIETTPEMLF
ncbi:MAG: hypothetical protein ACOX3R_15765 [Desulfitobacteriia bacterium]|jgi:hypothetical protein